jgi:Cys-rich protein (TIGR01571 family)
MPPDSNGSFDGHEIVEVVGEPGTPSGTTARLMDFIPIDIYIPSVERGALSESRRKRRFLDFLRAHPSKDWFLRSTFVGRLRRRSHGHQESADDGSDDGGRRGPRRRFRVPFVRKIKWRKLWTYAVSWCRKPENFAMIIWLAFVGAGLLLLLMLMTGMLDAAIPDDERRKKWTEVINQILNALFTIMCLYQHPKIFHHLVLLLRWRPDGDREEIRKVYCKDGAARPHDRAHMLLVVALLHVTCFAQYYCCALFWSYTRKDRPDWALNIGYGLGTGCPVVAGLYTAYSPLGRKEPDTESSSSAPADAAQQEHHTSRTENDGVEIKIYNRRVVVSSPEWSGGLFDCCDDGTVCALSATCTFCVFGWNMERLGFGNMYVHAFTFILLFVAPFLIFSVTALNIHDDEIRDTVVAVGVLLGFCGFLYGGFWRSQMRKRYKLPGGRSWWWCGSAAVGDCAKWLFCWTCALAQEVRTANFYDVEDDRFVAILGARNGEGRPVLLPLPREASTTTYTRSMSCPPKLDDAEDAGGVTSSLGLEMVEAAAAMERSATYHPMRPPLPPLMNERRQE